MKAQAVHEIAVVLAFVAAAAGPGTLPDRGVYPALDGRVRIALASWVPAAALRVRIDRERRLLTVQRGGDALKTYPIAPTCDAPTAACLGLGDGERAELGQLAGPDGGLPLAAESPAPADSDGDGIPDAVDILIGAKKTVLLATPYVETSRKLPYPGGDVPTDEGVCSDVVVRALRNAGIDLQQAIFEDAGRAPGAYPAIVHRNPSIDHRRVRNLQPYLERHFRKVPLDDLLPGDIVLLDTFPRRKGIEHIGIVSDRLGGSGRPLIINSWTEGYRTAEMDLLGFVPAPAAYRAPAGPSRAPRR
ncbi:MAG TPA: DUF1287 domain-containing protein [Polyangia bacterium]